VIHDDKAKNLNLLWAELIIEELARNHCHYVCLGPGSRSTPLTLAAARHSRIQTCICYDERAGLYRALGYARARNCTAAMITTSGTATASLLPAVTEAANDGTSLLLLTADRPPELLDTAANQVIQQSGLFSGHVRWQFDMPCPTAEIDPAFVLTTVDQALHRCQGPFAGPVHLNCMFREPFFESRDSADYMDRPSIRAWQQGDGAFTAYPRPVLTLSPSTLTDFCNTLQQTSKGLLFVGRLCSPEEQQAVRALAEKLSWPVYADLASGLRLDEIGTHIVRYFDQDLLSDAFLQRCRADTVLHIGGRVTSKRVPLFLQGQRPRHYIVMQDTPMRHDPVHAVTCHLECDIAGCVNQVTDQIQPRQDVAYTEFFKQRASRVDGVIARHIEGHQEITEPYVARRLTELMPAHMALFVSNSMPIRDVDIYGGRAQAGIRIGVNRGVSGIDGIIATAVGFAEGTQRPTTVLLGDLACIHDMNSLAMVTQCEQPIIVVVINNHGGGIFHFLPVAEQTDVFDSHFRTPHDLGFAGVAQTCGLAYCRPQTKAEFDEAYQEAVSKQQATLIELVTDSRENFEFRKQMKRAILEALEGSG
jgi:2-succinyl-5-enolpyruvyl-6-hydroxy-3-cyclohexene-1-carboxylate synthase